MLQGFVKTARKTLCMILLTDKRSNRWTDRHRKTYNLHGTYSCRIVCYSVFVALMVSGIVNCYTVWMLLCRLDFPTSASRPFCVHWHVQRRRSLITRSQRYVLTSASWTVKTMSRLQVCCYGCIHSQPTARSGPNYWTTRHYQVHL